MKVFKMGKILLCIILILAVTGCASGQVSSRTPPPVIDTGIDPEGWARVPAGEFLEGLNHHEVMIDYDYEIMLTDVTNAQFARYLNQALQTGELKLRDGNILAHYPGDPFHSYNHEVEIPAGDYLHMPLSDPGVRIEFDGSSFYPKDGYAYHPVVLVSWFGAKAFCEFYDWRLPLEFEWEKAARGTDGRAYPWGDEIARNNANYYSSHDLFEKIAGGLGDTTPVGFYNGDTYEGYQTLDSPSPFGLYDMAGNVWQWAGDIYEDTHLRYMRGGSKENYEYNLRTWTRNNAGPGYSSPNVGFRCVRDAAP